MNKAIRILGNQDHAAHAFATLDDLEKGEDLTSIDLDIAGVSADGWANSALFELRRDLRAGRISEARFDELLVHVTEVRRKLWDARVAA